jgi:hypothetical protein
VFEFGEKIKGRNQRLKFAKNQDADDSNRATFTRAWANSCSPASRSPDLNRTFANKGSASPSKSAKNDEKVAI